jgi:hypothetical protein
MKMGVLPAPGFTVAIVQPKIIKEVDLVYDDAILMQVAVDTRFFRRHRDANGRGA